VYSAEGTPSEWAEKSQWLPVPLEIAKSEWQKNLILKDFF